jgi:hypothetical protein
MKKQPPRNIFRYFSDQFIGSFTGFIIGIWASSLVSHFFATRSIKNLWGLTSSKTLVDKQTLNILQWVASVFVGYIVFELVLSTVKNQLLPRTAIIRIKFIKLLIKSGWYDRMKNFMRTDDSIVQELP